ncbi:uncharacterized protein LOC121991511 [Zingiber officinale]|uniref:uncharacterized protein LOC121991511 n=1 Tax=Zingiber officinale TaxID=94328 RepID=UPI001C4D42FF|nr:uncharacterized protein LOC121991511 [Zingiber officinale]
MSILPIPRLADLKYDNWSIQMSVLLESEGLWDIVERGYKAPQEGVNQTEAQRTTMAEQKRKDKKALFVIYKTFDEATFEKVAEDTTSKKAWEILQIAYKGDERAKNIHLQILRAEFESLEMKESENVSDYFTRVLVIVNQLKRNGDDIEDSRIVEKILRLLEPRYDYVIADIEESKDMKEMKVQELLSSLQAHEARMQRRRREPMEQALQTKLTIIDRKEESKTEDSQENDDGHGDFRERGRGRGRGRVSARS